MSALSATNYYGFDDWTDVGVQFEADVGSEPAFVYAVYSTPEYEGSATVIYFRDDEWWQVEGSHCSCHRLEKQWEPERIVVPAHFAARAQGKRIMCASDSEGDYPEATPEAFESWLDCTYAASRNYPKTAGEHKTTNDSDDTGYQGVFGIFIPGQKIFGKDLPGIRLEHVLDHIHNGVHVCEGTPDGP